MACPNTVLDARALMLAAIRYYSMPPQHLFRFDMCKPLLHHILLLADSYLLNGSGKVWDAVEVSGKNVMKTSSVVTTSVVTHR